MAPESRPPWRPSGLVTLLTDFGVRDAYVGVMKGVVARTAPRARCVDLTHEVPPQDVRTAAVQLEGAWRWFPEGTVHVAVVDPGVGSGRRILVARSGGHAFVAPDNGLLGPVLEPDADVRALDVERFALPRRSRTFHGRDVFAPAAARLADGLAPAEAGAPAGAFERLALPAPRRAGDGAIEAEVLLVDRFGNLVSNVPGGWLEGGADGWRVDVAGREVPLVGTYAEAPAGALVALVDSFDRLEVAVRDGDAARELGLGVGAPLVVRRSA